MRPKLISNRMLYFLKLNLYAIRSKSLVCAIFCFAMVQSPTACDFSYWTDTSSDRLSNRNSPVDVVSFIVLLVVSIKKNITYTETSLEYPSLACSSMLVVNQHESIIFVSVSIAPLQKLTVRLGLAPKPSSKS